MMRRITLICAFVLLGAVTTVGVAWGCAMFSELEEQPDIAFHIIIGEDRGWWFSASRCEGLGATRREVNIMWAKTNAERQLITESNNVQISDDYLITEGLFGLANPSTITPITPQVHKFSIDHTYWSRLGDYHNFDGSSGKFIEEEAAFGWPMLAMWCSYYTMDWKKDEDGKRIYQPAKYESAFQIPVSLHQLLHLELEDHSLPLQPIAFGFACNTVFYSFIWWIALVGITKSRRQLRLAKGKCVSCSYDLRGITSERCPECGIIANSA